MLTFDEVKKIQEAFVKEYMLPQKWREYVHLCSISKVGILDKNAPNKEKNKLCLRVGIIKQLPADMIIPPEFHGLKVLVSVIGEIRAA